MKTLFLGQVASKTTGVALSAGMNLSSFEWWALTIVGGILFGIVAYFLKRTMNTTDEHCTAINELKQTSATKDELKSHDEDINHIKQTYVTEDQMKEMRSELKSEIDKISANVDKIKEVTLPKEDFYRSHMETNNKLEKLQQLILDQMGGD